MMEYKDGYPVQAGWYECLWNGEPCALRHWICGLSGKHKWYDANGVEVSGKILWAGEPMRHG